MKYNRPIVLSIAGFDPTGGAGVLADVKTFEQNHCLGFGVLSASTVQSETQVLSVDWLSEKDITKQLEPLVSTGHIAAVKIGIIEQIETLHQVLSWLRERLPDVFIVWDPVLAASGGVKFLASWSEENLQKVLRLVDLITPNTLEVCRLADQADEVVAVEKLATHTHVLLKGGHSKMNVGTDLLYLKNGEIVRFAPTMQTVWPKHGSGCILSSAIAANIALGKPLDEACRLGKVYIEKRLGSNEQLLAYHAE